DEKAGILRFPLDSRVRGNERNEIPSGSTDPFSRKENRSQPQNSLGDDILLDLIRATVDRDLAHVEIARRERRRPLGSDRRFVPALVLEIFGLIRQPIGSDDFK